VQFEIELVRVTVSKILFPNNCYKTNLKNYKPLFLCKKMSNLVSHSDDKASSAFYTKTPNKGACLSISFEKL